MTRPARPCERAGKPPPAQPATDRPCPAWNEPRMQAVRKPGRSRRAESCGGAAVKRQRLDSEARYAFGAENRLVPTKGVTGKRDACEAFRFFLSDSAVQAGRVRRDRSLAERISGTREQASELNWLWRSACVGARGNALGTRPGPTERLPASATACGRLGGALRGRIRLTFLNQYKREINSDLIGAAAAIFAHPPVRARQRRERAAWTTQRKRTTVRKRDVINKVCRDATHVHDRPSVTLRRRDRVVHSPLKQLCERQPSGTTRRDSDALVRSARHGGFAP